MAPNLQHQSRLSPSFHLHSPISAKNSLTGSSEFLVKPLSEPPLRVVCALCSLSAADRTANRAEDRCDGTDLVQTTTYQTWGGTDQTWDGEGLLYSGHVRTASMHGGG